MSDRYYLEEYGYLVEEGREFARNNPDLARQLNLEDARGRDPNVERLLEGFAFLTSRIRKRLDDDFPELVEGLMSQIWPHHGRPLPSFCLLDLSPAEGRAAGALKIPAGAEVESDPVSRGLRCRYSTCAPLTVVPLRLEEVRGEALGRASRLTIRFALDAGADPSFLAREHLRIQFFGALGTCHQLYNLLLGREGGHRFLQGLSVQPLAAKGQPSAFRLGPEAVQPVGLEKDECLLPTGREALWNFNLLIDYFLYQEKYQACWLSGLDPLAGVEGLTGFVVEMSFAEAWPSTLRVSPQDLRLNCVPAANLFARDSEPIRMDHLRSDYKILVDTQNDDLYQVFTVDKVEGLGGLDGRRRAYQPLFAARNPLDQSPEELAGPYYSLCRRPSPWGGVDVYISFLDPSGKGRLPQSETVSLTLTCSNGLLGVEPLPGQINQAVTGIPEGVSVRNLNQPVAPVFPATTDNSLWNWLAHASMNFLNLDSAQRLSQMLSLLNRRGDESNRRRVEGVQAVRMERVREVVAGSLVTGNRMRLTLNQEYFSGPGDVQMFARVLGRFLDSYASLNSFMRLLVELVPSGKRIHIEPAFGAGGRP